MLPMPKTSLRISMKEEEANGLKSLPHRPTMACPDTGASCNVLNEKEAKRVKLKLKKTKVTLLNASGASMKVTGECVIYAAAPEGKTKRIRVIVSPDLVDTMLLGWRSQKLLGILHESWPGVMNQDQAQCNQVKVQQKEEVKKQQKKENKEKQDFPVDKEYKRV